MTSTQQSLVKMAQTARELREKQAAWSDWKRPEPAPASIAYPGAAGRGGILGGTLGGIAGLMNTTRDTYADAFDGWGAMPRSGGHRYGLPVYDGGLPVMNNPGGRDALSTILKRVGKYGLAGGGLGALALLAAAAYGRDSNWNWNRGMDQLDARAGAK